MFTTQWARLRTESSAPLRRGAWYRVLRLTNSDAVLDVNQRPINVPRPALQIASHPPATWGIVPRPVNARSLPSTWGARYAVCPKCHARASLPKGPVAMRCTRCGGAFDVGWGGGGRATSRGDAPDHGSLLRPRRRDEIRDVRVHHLPFSTLLLQHQRDRDRSGRGLDPLRDLP